MVNETLYNICNIEAEQSVLGAILLDKDCIEFIGDLKPSDFSKEYNKIIFEIMTKLHKKHKPIDLVTITKELRDIGMLENVGGISYITELSTIVPSTSNINHYANIVKELSNKRNLILEAYKLIDNLREGKDIDTSLNIFEKSSGLNTSNNNIESSNTLSEIMVNILEKLEGKPEDKIKTNLKVIDKHTNGIGKKELVAIGAGSGVGKSAIALKIAIEAYKQGKKVYIISREMSKEQVAERIIFSNTGIKKQKYENRDFDDNDWKHIIDSMELYSTDKIIIDDTTATIQGIKRAVKMYKPDLLIVDYVQLLTPTSKNNSREREVAEFSRELKNITLDFEMSVIQLTQLSDKGRGNTRPKGESYTRESRSIYHDSNVVIYIHQVTEESELENAYKRTIFNDRCSFEDMKTTVQNYEEQGVKFVEIIVDKNRNGSVGSNFYWFKGEDLSYYPVI